MRIKSPSSLSSYSLPSFTFCPIYDALALGSLSRSPVRCISRKATVNNFDPDHPFYNYTSGRWIYNESHRLSERWHYFNVDALCDIVSLSVGRSSSDIARFAKIAEGGSFRIFEICFRGNLNVIARLPYPSTIPHKYGIASEVATMVYLRLNGLPVPKVYGWSSSKSNRVGSEYIIMEKVVGKELESTWYTMTMNERKKVVEKIVTFESKLFSLKFPASGSLYFKDSLDSSIPFVSVPTDTTHEEAGNFCIGPSTEYLWWYRRRDTLEVNRGPWQSTGDVLTSVGKRELTWLQRFGKRRFPREPLYRELYGNHMVDPQIQMRNLSDYLKVVPHIVPKKAELNVPTIRHPDISPNNIFVSGSGDIAGVIDWQHSVVLPMFMQAKIPKHFQNYGDEDSENFQIPRLPEDFDSLPKAEREIEAEIYRRRQLHYFYLGFTSRHNMPHFHAMAKPDLVMRNRLYKAADRPWEGDNTSLKAELIQMSEYWPQIAVEGAKFPCQYSKAEIEECIHIDSEQKDVDRQMDKFRDYFGINIDGWVPNIMYEEAKEKERKMKEQMLDYTESDDERRELDENWPFQDHEEVD